MIAKLFAPIGKEVNIGGELFSVDTDQKAPAGQTEAKAAPKPAAPKEDTPKPETPRAVAAAPVAETPKAEVRVAARATEEPKKAAHAVVKPVVTATEERKETRERMSKMRQRIATRLKEAQNTAAMLTTFQDCDMSRAIEMRNTYKDEFAKKHGVRLGFMSFFIKAAAYALKEYPMANAIIDGDEIVYRNYMDIAVAVATPTGLIVPVIRNCQSLSFSEVEKTIAYYGEKGKTGQIPMEDMYGGTFTISNGGVYGSMMGTPIINPPQSSILGIHAIENRPVVCDDKIVARPMMYLALTYDHRILDGKNAVTFLRKIKLCVEDPSRLLLEL
jgi:2-oxoglutarate dehydrogenase E2 component (dihydrolipoamide succinyltransferase)